MSTESNYINEDVCKTMSVCKIPKIFLIEFKLQT